MKTKRNLLALMMLATVALASCGGDDTSKGDNPTNSEVAGGNEAVGTVLAKATFEGVTGDSTSLPEGAANWTYITNNDKFPNPSFNKDAFKFNYANQGMESPVFSAQSKVSANVLIDSLNAKGSAVESNGNPVFTFTALNSSNSVVDTETIDVPVVGDNMVTLEGNGIVKVNIKMTNIYSNGGTSYNIKVTSFEVKVA